MSVSYKKFQKIIFDYYTEHGRHNLPWRKNHSAYYVTVSEIMLQQTQVDRVIPFFNTWMKHFPNWKKLAEAPQSEVLRYWKGLGYNSRALRLQKLAQIVVTEHKGRLPQDYKTLLSLPGIGPYTAGAILAFAHNIYTPFIETNIRRVFIHYFFSDKTDVSDREIMETIEEIGEPLSARDWYAALMDYGATLPKALKSNPNTKSKHYTKQSKFKGSDREIRGKILEILLKEGSINKDKLFQKLGKEINRYEKIIFQLEKEGFMKQTKKAISLK